MATDREILKKQQLGALVTAPGISSPTTAIAEAHEATFTFINPAGSPLAEVGYTMVKKCRVKSIRALAGGTLSADGTNYVTGTIAQRDGAGGSATTIGTFTTNSSGGAALTAFQPTTVAVTATAAEIAAGAVLTYKLVDAASTTEPAIAVTVTVEYV